MSTIYDLAKIEAGDPQAQVGMAAGEALTELEQYKHQKQMIEEINEAYKDAEEKAKKGKKKWGLGGSLLGGLLSTLVPGGPLVAALLSGGSAALAEKVRQNTYDPTKALEEIDKKYKGRRLGEGIGEDIEEIESNLDSSILTDAVIAGLSSAIFGGFKEAGKAAGETGVTEEISGNYFDEVLSSEEIIDGISVNPDMSTIEGASSMVGEMSPFEASMQDLTEDSLYGFSEGYSPGTVVDKILVEGPNYGATGVESIPAIPSSYSPFTINAPITKALTGLDISKLIPKTGLGNPMSQVLLGLLKHGGTPLLQDLMMPETQGKRMAPAPLRNPFGGF